MDHINTSQEERGSSLYRAYQIFSARQQYYLDRITPYTAGRWVAWFILVAMFFLRMVFLQGWYIVTYALGIYLLNQFIMFLTPKIDPAMQDYEEDGLSLPTRASEEFRPFMRQLPELKFWYSTLKALLFATFCTFFDAFNIPVFWPVLVLYFFLLFGVTMKKQIKHMIKYKYLPFSHGKTRYSGNPDAKMSAK